MRSDSAAQAAIGAAAHELHLPTIRAEATRLSEIAAREHQSHLGVLAEVLSAEVDDRTDRRRTRRINEAKFPRLKRLADFNTDAVPTIGAATLGHLATGGYMDAGEPVVLLGDSGTGKSHLLIGLGLAACEQGRRVRYATTAQLVNELIEAADDRVLSRVVARYGRLDLLCLDLCRHRDYAEGRGGSGVTGVAGTCCWMPERPVVSRHSHRLSRNARTLSGGW